MKLRILAPIAISAALLTGCSGVSLGGGAPSAPSGTSTTGTQSAVLDLTGQWEQTNAIASDTYQVATITEDQITIDWVNDNNSTTVVYWIGSYEAPTAVGDTYAWVSQADLNAMDPALLASNDSTKTFTYANGVLSYDITVSGIGKTITLARQ